MPKAKEGRKHPLLQGSEGVWPWLHGDFTLVPAELRDKMFLLFWPPSLWYFVPAALGHYCMDSGTTLEVGKTVTLFLEKP